MRLRYQLYACGKKYRTPRSRSKCLVSGWKLSVTSRRISDGWHVQEAARRLHNPHSDEAKSHCDFRAKSTGCQNNFIEVTGLDILDSTHSITLTITAKLALYRRVFLPAILGCHRLVGIFQNHFLISRRVYKVHGLTKRLVTIFFQ